MITIVMPYVERSEFYTDLRPFLIGFSLIIAPYDRVLRATIDVRKRCVTWHALSSNVSATIDVHMRSTGRDAFDIVLG